jgi:hypothetical protein
MLGNGAVERTFAVGGVAHDRVRDVFHMASQLMPPPGQGLQFHLRPAGGGKVTLTQRQFTA